MIVTEFYTTREDGVKLFRTYSDIGMMIRQEQTGAVYSEAVDVEGSGMTYAETETPVEPETSPVGVGDAARYLLGQGLVEMPAQDEPDYFDENAQEPDYFSEGD